MALGAILTLALVAVGCDSSETTEPGTGDPVSADSLVQVAGDTLADMMDEMINQTFDNADSSFRPRDVDFTDPYNTYTQALNADPTNKDAMFGVAFCGLMIVMADDDLNNVYDDFKNLLDTVTLGPIGLIPRMGMGGPMIINGVPLSSSGFGRSLPDLMALDGAVIASAAGNPTISDIQNIFENVLLPRVIEARNYLINILADPAYTFTVTPAMQGDIGASPIELDEADFRVFLASTYALEAAIHIFVSRNLDLTYTVEGVETALEQTSDFLNLKDMGVGESHCASAKANILSAQAEFVSAVDALLAEVASGENQDDDLIQVYSWDVADLNEIKDTLISVGEFFNGPRELSVVIDDYFTCPDPWPAPCYWTEDTVRIMVDISQFFDNPIDNPKSLLPGYTLTLDTVADMSQGYADAFFDVQVYWDSLASIWGIAQGEDSSIFGQSLPTVGTDEFYKFLAHERQTYFGWDNLEFWCSPMDRTNLNCYWSYSWNVYSDMWHDGGQLQACYAWDAIDYAAWTWPNPTWNGLLPNYTSDSVKTLIYDDTGESDWIKEECGTTDIDLHWSDI
jgi:hypothetical protein